MNLNQNMKHYVLMNIHNNPINLFYERIRSRSSSRALSNFVFVEHAAIR